MDEALRAEIAQRAREMGLDLTPRHWEALEKVLAYYAEAEMLPTIRFLYRHFGREEAHRLFPQGMRTVAALLDKEPPEGC
jgi:sulfur relay (sulfurtransferase) DsrC/TusE family protein